MTKKIKDLINILLILLFMLLIPACQQKEDEAKLQDIGEIQQSQGIPVKVRLVGNNDFSTYLTFTSSFRGFEESTGFSLVDDTVEGILVEVGDYVEKDQPVILFPKNNPVVNYYQVEAAWKAAEQAFRRIKNLYNSDGVSRQTYDDTKTQYDVQSANWKMVNDMVEVKTPISGYITRLNVHTSDNVQPGDGLFTVSNYDFLSSVVWVADHEIRQISKGQKVSAEWEEQVLSGIVTQVDLSKDSEKKAFAVHVKVSNPEHAVPSGITANVDIETSLTRNAMVVHRNEMLKDQNGWYVYLDKNGYANHQTVKTGLRQGLYYQILSGLQPGDRLITEGLSLLRKNALIRVIEEIPLSQMAKN